MLGFPTFSAAMWFLGGDVVLELLVLAALLPLILAGASVVGMGLSKMSRRLMWAWAPVWRIQGRQLRMRVGVWERRLALCDIALVQPERARLGLHNGTWIALAPGQPLAIRAWLGDQLTALCVRTPLGVPKDVPAAVQALRRFAPPPKSETNDRGRF